MNTIIELTASKIRQNLEYSSSFYFTIEDANGNDVKIRTSNHSANRNNNSVYTKTLSFITDRTPQRQSVYNRMISEWAMLENGLTDTYETIEDILIYELGF